MTRTWLGLGLLAMGVAGLLSLMSNGRPENVAEEAGVPDVRTLPAFSREEGTGLYAAMAERASSRGFAGGKLSDEAMSKLLWAASGVNRKDGRWTIPTARNRQDLWVYVLDADGVWLYVPPAHALARIAEGDRRAVAGVQRFVAKAAANLVYVADLGAHADGPMPLEGILRCCAFEAGCAAQNVALACAAEGLKNVVRASYPEAELRAALELPETAVVLMAQSVGP